VKPFAFPVHAADAYAWWDEEPAAGPDPGALIAALETGNVELLGPSLFNDLQSPVARRHPAIADAIAGFGRAGALGATMTGSGPTVVALARHDGHAAALADAIPGSFVVSGPAVAG
jgi:4-diphosphocytidyl-2-C-methyl-D-erythritol kinase